MVIQAIVKPTENAAQAQRSTGSKPQKRYYKSTNGGSYLHRYRVHSSIREHGGAKRPRENRSLSPGSISRETKVPGAVAGGGGTQSIDT